MAPTALPGFHMARHVQTLARDPAQPSPRAVSGRGPAGSLRRAPTSAGGRGRRGAAPGGPVGARSSHHGAPAGLGDRLPPVLTPVKETGLAGARLAARVQVAMHGIPEPELRGLLGEIEHRARTEHLVYLRDEVEETIRLLATPITALPDQLTYVRTATLALHSALKRLPDLYFEDSDVRRSSIPPQEEAWLRCYWTPAVSEQNTVFGRHDAVIDFTSPTWKESLQFLEPNLGGIGGLHLIPTAERILADSCCRCCGARRRARAGERAGHPRAPHAGDPRSPGGHRPARPDRVLRGAQVRRQRPRRAGRAGPLHPGALRAEGLHADPAELALDGDEVTYHGQVVDLVYRDYAVEDLIELEGEGVDIQPMQQAVRHNRVMSSIAAELDQKSCWEVLTDPELAQRHFSSEERHSSAGTSCGRGSCARRHRRLPDGCKGDLAAYVRHAREELILKPNRAYGGTGVTVGPATEAGEWDGAGRRRPHARRRALGGAAARPAPVCEFPCWTPTGGSTPSRSTS